jgi:mercuric ion transport protein
MRPLQLTNASGVAAAALAVVASSCCAIPMALAFIGVSTGAVGLLGPLHEARPFVLGIAVSLLGVGWIYTLRARAIALRSGACPRGRFRLNFIVLASASLLVVVALSWQVWDPMLERLVMRMAQR